MSNKHKASDASTETTERIQSLSPDVLETVTYTEGDAASIGQSLIGRDGKQSLQDKELANLAKALRLEPGQEKYLKQAVHLENMLEGIQNKDGSIDNAKLAELNAAFKKLKPEEMADLVKVMQTLHNKKHPNEVGRSSEPQILMFADGDRYNNPTEIWIEVPNPAYDEKGGHGDAFIKKSIYERPQK